MIIERIEIRGFRALKAVQVDCDELVAIVGRNGQGKSSILYALDVFYDTNASVTLDDFHNRDGASPIEIRVTYSNLTDQERAEFGSFIQNDRLMVTKRIETDGQRIIQRYFGAALQIPEFAEFRRLGKRERSAALRELITSAKYPGLEGAPRSADAADALINEYEAAHPESCQPIERQEQFFGPKNIGGGKLDKFTRFVLVPAVRDASVEAQRKGVVYELIDTIVLRRINLREDVKQLRNEIKERVTEVMSPENLTELGDLGQSISALLGTYAPGAELRLTWQEPIAPELSLPNANVDLVEDDFDCPVTHAGHGLQRALILTLLQHLATVGPHLPEIEEGADDGAENGPSPEHGEVAVAVMPNPDLILAIEEPELYLHPSRCRYLAGIFSELTRAPETANEPRNQVIYATHSPYFVDLDRFDQIRIARKQKGGDDEVPHCQITRFSLAEAASEMARICERDPAEFTRETFRARALPIMTVSVNEGFFANAVVVVEGLSDVGALWKLQELLDKRWESLGAVLVPAGGKENLDRPVVVFRGLGIPTCFVFDADRRLTGQARDNAIARNRRYQFLAGVEAPVEFPDSVVHETWAVHGDDLEATVRDAIGEQNFNDVRSAVAEELGYDRERDVLKNVEGSARAIEICYERGLRVPILEDIVERITELAEQALAGPEIAGPE